MEIEETKNKMNLLYLDDDMNNLVPFKAHFRRKYNVQTTTDAEEALQMLSNSEIQIILTDQKMPAISGTEFLEKTIPLSPDSIRLLITGQSDLNDVIEAINRGQVNKYVQKPWDWDKLEMMIESCEDLYHNRMEIKIKNLELEKTNDELNRFIYSASHDLRSPLMSILGIVQLSKLEANYNPEYIHIIESNILKLDEYIKNLIAYYQNTRASLEHTNIDFKELVEEVIGMLQNQDLKVNFETKINQGAEFVNDLFRVRIILNNLISNAMKFQNPLVSEPKILIEVESNEEMAILKISDNGLGIHADHIESIFKMFYRAQNGNKKQGSGIGLFIVKESVDKISGTIGVESTPNVGTQFEIQIPNKKNDASEA